MSPLKSTLGRWTVSVFAGCILAFGLLLAYARIFSGSAKQRLPSPDGETIAEVREFTSLSAMDADYLGVQVRTKLNPFRHFVFAGLDDGIKITISWIDSKTLQISCERCEQIRTNIKEDAWRDVSIRYVSH
jgi:hypothetical protein